MATVSKYALIFKNRVLSFDQDVDLMDIICKAQQKNDFLTSDNELLFKYQQKSVHTSLASRRNTKKSKDIVVTHLKKSVYTSYIKDIYEEVTMYFSALLSEAALISHDSDKVNRLLGEHKIEINAKQLLTYTSLDELKKFVAERIIQLLELERSTILLIKKVCNKLDIEVEQNLIEEAIPYLEIRHKLVHAAGKADEIFQEKYDTIKCDQNCYIVLNKTLLKNAKSKITQLIMAIDKVAIEKGILSPNK